MVRYNFDYISPKLRSLIKPATLGSHYFKGELSFKEYSDAYIAPFLDWETSVGCCLDSQGNGIDNLFPEWFVDGRYYDINKAETEHKTVIFLGFLIGVFGHAFIDNFRTLWFLQTDICKRLLAEGAELVYTKDWNEPFSDIYVKIFKMVGFDIREARLVDHLTKFDKVIIPDSSIASSENGRIYCDTYCSVLDRIKDQVWSIESNPDYDKIYFTRSKFPKKRETGEEIIEDYFRRARFTIISPEQHPLETQFQMVRSCSCFATTEGSIAHLSLFCRPGTKVILINKSNYLNMHQVMINELADLDVTYIQAHHSSCVNPEYPWLGFFFLYPTQYLRRYFGGKPGLPWWLSKDYWSYYFGTNPKTRTIKKIYRYLLKKVRS